MTLLKKSMIILLILFPGLNAISQQETGNRVYEIWDNQPAPNRGKDFSVRSKGYPADHDWEAYSYPIGNGYMGANIFGRTDVERLQVTEKTLANEGLYGKGGLTNFCEVYLEFNHYNPTNYKRSLNLNDAILYVDYDYKGVHYSREYLANYPANIIAVKLTSNKKKKISFTLRAEIPYLRGNNEINTKYGKVTADNNLLTLSGSIKHFSNNFEGQIKVLNEGGKLYAQNDNGSEIRVENANSVVLLIAAGTNYELSEKVFLQESDSLKLAINKKPHEKVSETIKHATEMGYKKLKASHLEDFRRIFSRVKLELSAEVPDLPTKTVVGNYRKDPSNPYLEELLFQYGRYLLISSSRKGTLPCGLQGVWSQYLVTPWTGGYWHNINVQMNYWGAFNTNMAETFLPYIEYYKAYLPKTQKSATSYIEKNNPTALDGEGDNGWYIGSGSTAYIIGEAPTHSGPGTTGFTSKLFWEYYDFTRDTAFLRRTGYPALLGASKFLSKTVKPDGNGLLLVNPSASPEIRIKDENGDYKGPHYRTIGATFDQGFVWENHHDLLKAADILGSDDTFLRIVKDQINRLDPVNIGTSGQIKEYREENEYGEIGDPHHRHISQLCPVYPGTLIDSTHPEWAVAASKTLDFRGNEATGWGMAHRMNVRARLKEAEKAHEIYSLFIQERVLDNLWSVHPPFQIDGNLGTMAGVAEMLIQSHEGFIELLPALPKAWSSGSFDGLVARGNFVFSVSWEKKKMKSLKIVSRSGAVCKLKLDKVGEVQIKDRNGEIVPFERKENNIIEFNTRISDEYFVEL
ncbi:MAG TPA: glycoside hydrolase N-terminal domain-containing protein [Bacteroidales bacterium]|nr:glycoside hydrolase N-terminal domain-containing protein [Bacteroidales bacterium]